MDCIKIPLNEQNSKKATIDPKSNDDKRFKYAIKVELLLEQNKSHTERISKIESFINKYNLTGKSLNQIIKQSLLIFYTYHTITNK